MQQRDRLDVAGVRRSAAVAISMLVAAVLLAGCAPREDPSTADPPPGGDGGGAVGERPTTTTPAPPGADQPTPPDPGTPAAPEQEMPPTEHVVRDCPPFGVTGMEGAEGAGYYDISARNVSCEQVKRYLLESQGREGFPAAAAAGYTCRQLSSRDEEYQYRCVTADGQRAFRFWFGA